MILLLLAACPGPEDSAADLAPCGGSGVICPYAGTGIPALGKADVPATESHLYLPQDLTFGPDGDAYVLDWNNHRIIQIDEEGIVHVVAGNGLLGDGPEGDALTASFNHPTNITFAPDGTMVVAAWHNSRVERIDLEAGTLSYWVGDGTRSFGGDGGDALVAKLNLPSAVAFDAAGQLYVSDQANQRVRCVHTDNTIDSVIGNGTAGYTGDGGPAADAEINADMGQQAAPGNRILISPDQRLFIADTQNQAIRVVDLATMVIDTYAGSGVAGVGGDGGPAKEAKLFNPADIAMGVDGELYIADTENSCVRVVSADGTIDTFAGICGVPGYEGDGGDAVDARLYRPYGVAVDASGNVYVADTYNQVIRVVGR